MTSLNAADPLVGRVLDDRYELRRRLARGGMATVYVAEDQRLSRTVAVKVMHEGLGSDHDFIKRFEREAKAAAQLNHPNIVAVFDKGFDHDRPYIVMEYVEGCTLRNVITREAPMDPLRTLDLMLPVVSALAAAHDAGLMHLDIKPENVLLSDRGQIKVADFGLARAVSGQTATASAGLLIGTVSYIAPELVTQGKPSPRADVYGVGVVLYEMLTGHKPHTGDSPIQVAYSHVHNQVPPPSQDVSTNWRNSRSGIPPYLDALVTTAAARMVDERPADARVLLNHMLLAREALASSVMDNAELTAQMKAVRLDSSSLVTQQVPVFTAPTELTPTDMGVLTGPGSALRGLPSARSSASPVRLTASTPLSPNAPLDTGDIPYHADAAPEVVPPAVPPTPVARHSISQESVHRRRRSIVLILLLVLALGLGGAGWWWGAGRWTTTPQLAHLTQSAAVDVATKAGLKANFTPEYSEDVPAGEVTRTNPSAGERILTGGTLDAYLSKGPERYAVPVLAGASLEAATKALTDTQLAVGTVTQSYHDTIGSGMVISASQDAGTLVKPGTKVDLVVSQGPAPIQLADYTGKVFNDTKAQLEAAGLKVAQGDTQNSATIPAGSIISQSPGAGTVHKGDTITFVVSKGPVMVTVPNVYLQSPSAATAALKKDGFQVEVKYVLANGFNRVLTTSPAWGTQAPEGSTVTINIA